VKEMKVVRVLFGLFCILSLIHAVRIEAQTLSEVEREHPELTSRAPAPAATTWLAGRHCHLLSVYSDSLQSHEGE